MYAWFVRPFLYRCRSATPVLSKITGRKCHIMSNKTSDHLVWVDCEMSGLDIEKDFLIEVCAVITDGQLSIVDTCGPLVIHRNQKELEQMNDWCKTNFAESGLTQASLNSSLSVSQLDRILSDFLERNQIEKGIIAGNSVYMDRIFLNKELHQFTSKLHYNLLDVSSFRQAYK